MVRSAAMHHFFRLKGRRSISGVVLLLGLGLSTNDNAALIPHQIGRPIGYAALSAGDVPNIAIWVREIRRMILKMSSSVSVSSISRA